MQHNFDESTCKKSSFERKFASQIRRSKCSFKTNTLPNIKRRQELYRSAKRVDIIRYSKNNPFINEAVLESNFNHVFTPEVHSTPNVTIENEHFNFFLKKHKKIHPCIPTISNEVDKTQTNYELPQTRYIVNEREVKAKRWLSKLYSSEPTKFYLKQISFTLSILITLLIIGGLLICYSKHFVSLHIINFTNFTATAIPDIKNLSFMNENYSYNENKREILNKCKLHIDITVNKPVEYKSDEITTERQLIKLCNCSNVLDICMVDNENGIPICKQAIDVLDPTGCGGLCALEVEACHLLHVNYSVYTCKHLHLKPLCKNNEWQCKNSFCISKEKRCDGLIDCYDHSDEADCLDCDLTTNFQCGNKTSCLDISKKCDGIVDCWDGFDEHNCSKACSENQFSCKTGECIESSSFCDGYVDCTDRSDEFSGCKESCEDQEFRCMNKRCIPINQKCNRFDNCGDMSDELQCIL